MGIVPEGMPACQGDLPRGLCPSPRPRRRIEESRGKKCPTRPRRRRDGRVRHAAGTIRERSAAKPRKDNRARPTEARERRNPAPRVLHARQCAHGRAPAPRPTARRSLPRRDPCVGDHRGDRGVPGAGGSRLACLRRPADQPHGDDVPDRRHGLRVLRVRHVPSVQRRHECPRRPPRCARASARARRGNRPDAPPTARPGGS